MKVVMAILLFLSICVGTNCKTAVDARISQRELEVYKSLLGDKPKELVVIHAETVFDVLGITRDNFKEILKGVRNDTLDDFIKVNSVPPKIEDDVKTKFNYPLVNGTDFNFDNLEHARYYVFSRAGFSRVCHPLCGRGSYYWLENKNGVWVITQESEYVRS